MLLSKGTILFTRGAALRKASTLRATGNNSINAVTCATQLHVSMMSLGLPLRLQAPIMTPNGVIFLHGSKGAHSESLG